ncbi:MAG: hypothetical protein BMS9Abin37_3132 [Acidobacteriota bacterium]|nr:MAG: hypothetical protein BMS9Abin37_3132 [Acidobacteriota bacterium]
MAKTEVYSWRLSEELKGELEEAAKQERQSVSGLLERIVDEWLHTFRVGRNGNEEEQKRLHRAAARSFGKIAGGDPARSEKVRQAVTKRLTERRAR